MNIKLCISDVDGSLTDGFYHVSDNGIVTKSFHTRDFYAIQKLQEIDIPVLLLTHCYDNAINAKIDGIPKSYSAVPLIVKLDWNISKEDFLSKHIKARGIDYSNVAFFGDSENDLKCMERCGLTGCPNDAVSIIKHNANYVCDARGGHAAFYEFVSYLATVITDTN